MKITYSALCSSLPFASCLSNFEIGSNKICVDMAFGSPYGANTTNLICNWGFHGLLVEGGSAPTSFFKTHKDTSIFPPKVQYAWITAENVNDLCLNNGVKGEIDLLCHGLRYE